MAMLVLRNLQALFALFVLLDLRLFALQSYIVLYCVAGLLVYLFVSVSMSFVSCSGRPGEEKQIGATRKAERTKSEAGAKCTDCSQLISTFAQMYFAASLVIRI